jgi:Protein of unknown function (DUF3515)
VPDRQQGTGLSDGPPRWLLITGIAVATAAVVVVLIVAATMHRARRSGPPVIAPTPAPQATSPQCQALMGALPQRLGEYERMVPGPPVPPATAAWRGGAGGQPVVVRCGLDRPADFVVGAPIQVVDSVQWFREPATGTDLGSTWVTVDRPVYIALTLPQGSGPTPIQQVSDVITAMLPAAPIRPGPPG